MLDRVDLVSTEEAVMNEVTVRKFRLEGVIRADADAAVMNPVKAERVRDAMDSVAQRQGNDKTAVWSGIFGKVQKPSLTQHDAPTAPTAAAKPQADAPAQATVPTGNP
ncbi:MAG: hypothetical protein QM783_16390 [Phycisphaerales bacterium]